ncbi:hypothetical protein BDP55DRAFT_62300 [Colletotrichum godetiae]|uniref:Uncharacterized protein n=1 Tax=Colletotrichum godetiae TaxID=1209918 RepID=A0AAJ0F077_9PEZI|nr:uncharacterized protein BDP55DRAFT_62300 [Colletotrichum godetiae]KAK1688243.1 hypothetical protein BDP55DRAFT_62300 [Colletotrichum godetiae]
MGLDCADNEVRKSGCTAIQSQNIHAAAHLARLWCGGVSGPSLIRGRCNLITEAASRSSEVGPLPAPRHRWPSLMSNQCCTCGGWYSRDAIGGRRRQKQGNADCSLEDSISCPQQSLFSKVATIHSPSVSRDAQFCEELRTQNVPELSMFSAQGRVSPRRCANSPDTPLFSVLEARRDTKTTAPNCVWRFLESGTLVKLAKRQEDVVSLCPSYLAPLSVLIG